jgi:sugar phosphate isomerase/epimerase
MGYFVADYLKTKREIRETVKKRGLEISSLVWSQQELPTRGEGNVKMMHFEEHAVVCSTEAQVRQDRARVYTAYPQS